MPETKLCVHGVNLETEHCMQGQCESIMIKGVPGRGIWQPTRQSEEYVEEIRLLKEKIKLLEVSDYIVDGVWTAEMKEIDDALSKLN